MQWKRQPIPEQGGWRGKGLVSLVVSALQTIFAEIKEKRPGRLSLYRLYLSFCYRTENYEKINLNIACLALDNFLQSIV